MATARKWSNVQISMQSAIATAKTIASVSKAAEGIVSCAAHGYSNGDYILLNVSQGMYQLNGRVARVKNVATDSFTLDGVDTSLFDVFESGAGSAQKLTFGTSISTATTISSDSNSGFEMIDITTIHDSTRRQIPGLANAASFSFENIWDISDGGLQAMKVASDAQAQRAFRFVFGVGGQIMVFNGYPAANLLPGGQTQGLVTTSAAITMTGAPTYYAS